jgi:hypothetical protein
MRLHHFLGLLLLTASAGRASAIIFDNTTNDTGFTDSFSQNNLVEAGDQIQLTAGALADTAVTSLFNSAETSGIALTVTLRLYSVDALNSLGSLITSSTLDNVSFPATSTLQLTFPGLNVVVPQDLVWTLSFTTQDPIALELPNFDPPTVGNSDNTTVWWDTGSGLQLTTPGFDTENYYFQLSGDTSATPEPGGALPTILGLLAVAVLQRRWRRQNSRTCTH